MKQLLYPRPLFLIIIIVIAAITRLLPHPPNVTPIAAMALFGGAYFMDKKLAFIVPLAAMLLSDAFIGFHPQMSYVYFSFVLIGIIGILLRNNVRPGKVFLASIASSLIFFLITNFGVWLSGGFPMNAGGLLECYTVAIPFLRNTLLGDLLYCTLLFGVFELAKMRFPQLGKA